MYNDAACNPSAAFHSPYASNNFPICPICFPPSFSSTSSQPFAETSIPCSQIPQYHQPVPRLPAAATTYTDQDTLPERPKGKKKGRPCPSATPSAPETSFIFPPMFLHRLLYCSFPSLVHIPVSVSVVVLARVACADTMN